MRAARPPCALASHTSTTRDTRTTDQSVVSTSRPATRPEGRFLWPEPCEGWGSTWASSRTTTPGAATTATRRGRATTTASSTGPTAATPAGTTGTPPTTTTHRRPVTPPTATATPGATAPGL